jgi:hypothetical protein
MFSWFSFWIQIDVLTSKLDGSKTNAQGIIYQNNKFYFGLRFIIVGAIFYRSKIQSIDKIWNTARAISAQ